LSFLLFVTWDLCILICILGFGARASGLMAGLCGFV
jgi:hypothetical protein